jgi:hypothetical protein
MGKAVMDGVMKDGTIKAAFRQGAGEIGEALKAFPDSIQVRELGTVLSPTPGEISQDRGTLSWDREENAAVEPSLADKAREAAAQSTEVTRESPETGLERDR